MKEFLIQKNCTIIEALKQISKSGEKSLIVVNSNNKLLEFSQTETSEGQY